MLLILQFYYIYFSDFKSILFLFLFYRYQSLYNQANRNPIEF